MNKEELEKLTVEELFEMLPKQFCVGPTLFQEPEKKWLCDGYYNPLWEYAEYDGIFDPSRYLEDKFKETAFYYGASVKEVLIETIYNESLK